MLSKLTPEVLVDLETPAGVRLSPDGKHVVYALRNMLMRKGSLVSSLWLAEVGKENSTRQLTQGQFNDTSPQFSPDGRYISFLSDRAKQGKALAIYLMPVKEGGEAWPLTSTELDSGVKGYDWSPDGKFIAFMSADEKSEERKKKDENKDDAKVYGEEWQYNRLRTVSVESKEVKTVFSANEHISLLAWSPDGGKIAFCSYPSPELNAMTEHGADVKIVNLEDQTVGQLCHFQNPIRSLVWHEDKLIWTGNYDQGFVSSSLSLYSIPAKLEKSLSSRAGYGIDSCAAELRKCIGGVVVKVIRGLSDQLQLLGSTTMYNEEHDLKGWDAVLQGDERTLAIIKGSISVPQEVFSIVAGKTCQLSQHNEEIASLNIGTSESFVHYEDGKIPLDGVLCIPASLNGQHGERKPQKTIVFPHGGPYERTNIAFDIGWNWAPWLVSLGYVVLCPNYRGGSSHGNEYAKAVRGNAEASYPDVIALVNKGIDAGIIDKNRVAIAGWSQGGYLSYLSVTRDSTFHFSAAICGAGVSDWDSMVTSSDLWAFESELGGSAPWSCALGETKGRSGSPIYFMQDIKTPVLILHGEDDERVPVSQALGFHRGMLAQKKECEMVIYPREGHSSSQKPWERAHHIDMLKRIEVFVANHL